MSICCCTLSQLHDRITQCGAAEEEPPDTSRLQAGPPSFVYAVTLLVYTFIGPLVLTLIAFHQQLCRRLNRCCDSALSNVPAPPELEFTHSDRLVSVSVDLSVTCPFFISFLRPNKDSSGLTAWCKRVGSLCLSNTGWKLVLTSSTVK